MRGAQTAGVNRRLARDLELEDDNSNVFEVRMDMVIDLVSHIYTRHPHISPPAKHRRPQEPPHMFLSPKKQFLSPRTSPL